MTLDPGPIRGTAARQSQNMALNSFITRDGLEMGRAQVVQAEACGREHPGLIECDAVEVLTGRTASTSLDEVYGYEPGWGLPSERDRKDIVAIMAGEAVQGGSAPPSPSAVG